MPFDVDTSSYSIIDRRLKIEDKGTVKYDSQRFEIGKIAFSVGTSSYSIIDRRRKNYQI